MTPYLLSDPYLLFMEKWLPGMERDEILVAVFPTPEGKSIYVQQSMLLESLEEELIQYE